MMGCCIAMVAGAGIAVAGSLAATGSVDWMSTVLPLVICGGAHLAMMVFMGRSCHTKADAESSRTTDIVNNVASPDLSEHTGKRAVERLKA